MPNPYETTGSLSPDTPRFRSVRGLVAWSVLLAFSAYPPLSSGLRLLNQELGLFPTSYATYDIQINDVAVSSESFVASSILAGLLLLSIAAVLALRARRNYKYNSGLAFPHATQTGG